MNRNIPPKDYEYTTLMNLLHVSVSKHLLDEHFTLVWANEFYYDMIGYEKDEYEKLYHNRPDLYYGDDKEHWNQLGEAVLRTKNAGENQYSILTRMRCKGSNYIWVQLASTFVDEYIDGYQVAYTTMTDVTAAIQVKTEQSITYDNLPGFVGKYQVSSDLEFKLLDANDRFVDFFGESCWKGTKDPLFRKNQRRTVEALADQKERVMAGEPVHFTAQMQNQYGDEAWLQINAACVEWRDNEPVYLAIYIDITNETQLRRMQTKLENQAKELQAALNLAEQANRAKSDFLSHMSHDIRTPMNAIIGMTDIARSNPDDPEKVQDCLRKISLSSQHLLGLINDVLDMSRIESGKMMINNSSMSLPELLENVVAIIQPHIKAKNQQFSIHLRGVKDEWFDSDALRLRQIFLNILSNASKFTPVEGKITINVEELPDIDEKTARLCFTFSDSGIGIKPEFLTNLFAPFTREHDSRVDKTEGSGLGMAITKKLVDLLDGEITVSSQPGVGTTFKVTLPMQIDEKPQSFERFEDLNILVVDDDETVCRQMEQSLMELGVQTVLASSGETAVKLVSEAKDKKEYDAVFLDWKMPGMDGKETARCIRSLVGVGLPILIVSAYDWSDIEEEAHEAGIDGFISKPLFVSTIYRALQVYVLGNTAEDITKLISEQNFFQGRRFLLVEDNELNREIAVTLLESAGAEMECAKDGLDGVNKFINAPEHYYDLILMDVQMPVMNGYDATSEIRRADRADAKTIPIVAMTADAFAEDVRKAKESGMNGHLAKPLDAAAMKREIKRILS